MSNGKAVPRAYPITAPMPPHVAAEAGPNKIQAPSADAVSYTHLTLPTKA